MLQVRDVMLCGTSLQRRCNLEHVNRIVLLVSNVWQPV